MKKIIFILTLLYLMFNTKKVIQKKWGTEAEIRLLMNAVLMGIIVKCI